MTPYQYRLGSVCSRLNGWMWLKAVGEKGRHRKTSTPGLTRRGHVYNWRARLSWRYRSIGSSILRGSLGG